MAGLRKGLAHYMSCFEARSLAPLKALVRRRSTAPRPEKAAVAAMATQFRACEWLKAACYDPRDLVQLPWTMASENGSRRKRSAAPSWAL